MTPQNRHGCEARRAVRQNVSVARKGWDPISKMIRPPRLPGSCKPCTHLGPLAPVSSDACSGFPTRCTNQRPPAAFSKESRTRFNDATDPDRKSGGADLSPAAVEGSCRAPFPLTTPYISVYLSPPMPSWTAVLFLLVLLPLIARQKLDGQRLILHNPCPPAPLAYRRSWRLRRASDRHH